LSIQNLLTVAPVAQFEFTDWSESNRNQEDLRLPTRLSPIKPPTETQARLDMAGKSVTRAPPLNAVATSTAVAFVVASEPTGLLAGKLNA
jgi:hypothetical protein